MKHWKRFRAVLAVILVAVMLVQMSIVAFAENTEKADSVITEPVVTEPVVESESEQEAQIIAELTDERQEYEKRFMLSNGSMMAVQYAMPVHFLGEGGNWIQYDNRMQETSSILDTDVEKSSSTEYRVIESDSDVRLSKKAGDKKIVTIAKDGHQISWGFVGVNKVELELTDVDETAEGNDKFLNLTGIVQEGWYRDAFENADLQYLILPTGVKENIILKSADAPTEFELEYKFKKLTAVQIDSKTIDLQDSEGNVVYTITAPNMQDANGAWSDALSLTIIEQKNNKLRIKLTIDEDWINSAERAFPITVDPTLETEQNCIVIDSTMISSGHPDDSFGKGGSYYIGTLYVGNETISNFNKTRSFIRLNNLPQLSPGDVVVDAELVLRQDASSTSIQVNAHKVTCDWGVNTATWNNMSSANNYEPEVLDYVKTTYGEIDRYDGWNITGLVREWYSGTSANNGIMLMSPSENSTSRAQAVYYSSSFPNSEEVRPYFLITYLNNRGLENYWTYSQQSLSNGATGYINDFSGNLVYQVPVMQTSGERSSIGVSLVYNGYNAAEDLMGGNMIKGMGKGWQSNWNQYLYPIDQIGLNEDVVTALEQNGYRYIYIDGDGTVHYFSEVTKDNVTVIEDEDGLGMTIKSVPGATERNMIKCQDGTELRFSFFGALSEVVDPDGNTITVTFNYIYDIETITDATGRVTTFNYDIANYRLDSVVDPFGRVTKLSYTGDDLTKVTYLYKDEEAEDYNEVEDNKIYIQFEYETATVDGVSGYRVITKAIDIDGSYLKYAYPEITNENNDDEICSTQVESVQEFSNTGRTGNKIEISYNDNNTTTYTYVRENDPANTVSSTYEFDNFGRTVCIRNDDGSFSQVGYYSTENGDKANRIKYASSGEEYVNNLLVNSSAENSNISWSKTDSVSTMSVDSENYFLGYKSFNVTAEASRARTGYYQDVAVTANTDYTFSTYVKTDNVTATGTNGAGMYVKFYDASNNEIANSAQKSDGVKGTNGWQRINFTFTTPVGAVKARVCLVLMNATGTAYFDCAQLEDGNTMNDYNMLQNSSFSSATAWTMSNLASGDGVTSNGKLKITGSASQSRSATQTVQINRQKTSFTFSAVAEGRSVPLRPDTDRAFGVKLKVYFSNGDVLDDIASFNTATSAEQKASATVMIPSDYQEFAVTYVEYSLIYNSNANSVTYDNCMLTFDETGTSYEYDDNGNLKVSFDNGGGSSSYIYNEKNELINYTNGNGSSYSYTYSSEDEHQIIGSYSHQTYNGVVYGYDDYGNINSAKFGAVNTDGELESTNSQVANKKYIQNETDYTAYMKDENGNYICDENGNKIVDEQKSGNYVTSVTDQQNKTTTYNVDQTSGLTENVVDANQNVVRYTYYRNTDLPLTISSQRTGGSSSSTEIVTYGYDEYNRLYTINHNGFDYVFSYDDFGNTDSITVAGRTLIENVYAPNNGYLSSKIYGNDNVDNDIDENTTYDYTYDNYGRVTSVAVNGVTKFNTVYNKKGQVAYVLDVANNQKIVYDYDISGRIIGIKYIGVAEISTTYDGSDRITSITYDFAGQTKTVSFVHAVDGLKGIATLISGDQKTTTYDELNREISSEVADLESKTTYKDIGADKTTTLVENLTYEYDGTQLFNESYTYDALSNIKTVTNNGVTITYSYDSLNQLTRASGTNGTVTKYFYNDGGNINYKVNADGSKTHYVYDSQWKDLLVGFDGQTISYDGIGNPIVYRDGMVFSWTARQLDAVTINNSTNISYNYDINGIRIKKNVDNVITEYFVDGSTIVAEKTGDNVIWYMYDIDGRILGFTYNDIPYYYVKNVQGDIIKVVDANGAVVASYTYDPWGKLLDATGSMAEINHIRYRGYYYDNETGLYYLNSRYYDPETCRFINADAYLTTGQGLLSYNMFAYCLNDPINNVDPSGCLTKRLFDAIKEIIESVVQVVSSKIAKVTTEVPPPIIDMTIADDVSVETINRGDGNFQGVHISNSSQVTNKYQQIYIATKVISMAKENGVDMGFATNINDIITRWDSYNTLYDMGVYMSVTGNLTFGKDDLANLYKNDGETPGDKYGYVDKRKTNGYGFVPDFLLLDSVECEVPLFAQQRNFTCGSASGVMVLAGLGITVEENDFWDYADNDATASDYTRVTRTLNHFLEDDTRNIEYAYFSKSLVGEFNIAYEDLSPNVFVGFIIASLNKGRPVIVRVKTKKSVLGYSTSSEHYVVVTAVHKDENGTYMVHINDPYSKDWRNNCPKGQQIVLSADELYDCAALGGLIIYGRK